MSQTASNLAVRFARAQPRIEGAFDEQGVSQGVEAVSFVNLAEFGRGSKRRDGPAIGFNLAVANEPFQERTNLETAVRGARIRSAWRSTTRRAFAQSSAALRHNAGPVGISKGSGRRASSTTASAFRCVSSSSVSRRLKSPVFGCLEFGARKSRVFE